MVSIDDLTAEQRSIVDASCDSRVLVTAGPGTGKTHVLIDRLARLISDEGLNPAQGVLVLTFSRSAVKSIRDRVITLAHDVRYVRVSTFDSFATRLLRSEDPDGSWLDRDYEGRIEAATGLILAREDLPEIDEVRHIFIDEVQDLVGSRFRLVKSLLEHVGSGFTIFGDPAQGIYDFQLPPGPERQEGSRKFYRWLRERFPDLIEASLTKNFRAQRVSAQLALWAGEALNARGTACEEAYDKLLEIVRDLPSLGGASSAAAALRRVRDRTAVLCRDNGQALLVSRALYEANVEHVLQRESGDRPVVSWLARLLFGLGSVRVTKANVAARAGKLPDLKLDPDRIWSLMKRLDPGRHDDIQLRRVNRCVATGDVPDDLLQVNDVAVTVSSIHRAKGLEYAQVAIVEPPDYRDEKWSPCEEARLLYVALTRASMYYYMLASPEGIGLSSQKNPEHRWVRRLPFRSGYASMTLDVEVRGGDVDNAALPGRLPGLTTGDPVSEFEYLAEEVRVGDPLVLNRMREGAAASPYPVYTIEHRGRAVGVTNKRFGMVLRKTIDISKTKGVPERILDCRVDCVASVAGDPALSRSVGLGESGLWLQVRPCGLGKLKWA